MKPRKAKLAASFVVTVATLGCRKETLTDPPVTTNQSAYINRNGDRCTMSEPMIGACPKGVSCNPPAPAEIDCPPSLRDAGEPGGPTARPTGKEDWLRIRPTSWSSPYGCSYTPERFCAPPPRPHECTPYVRAIEIKCPLVVADGGAGDAGKAAAPNAGSSYRLESFVYKDGLGTCHRVPSFVCTGDCMKDMPPDTPVPCP